MKKTLILFSFIILAASLKAQVVTIADSAFNNYLLSDTIVNSNQDSLLQLSEIEAVTHLNIANLGIIDLTGIKNFSTLTNLNCSNNQLSALDISGNLELDTLICDSNNIASICVNSKQNLNISENPSNWVKDSLCAWSRTNCSIENDACFALYYTTIDTPTVGLYSTFYLWVDSLTTAKATSFFWDFGDGNTSKQARPANFYNCDCLYDVCMKITTANGDSCEYCHTFGLLPPDFIFKHGARDGYIVKVMQFGDTIVGIDSKETFSKNYTLYPNPTEGILHLDFEKFGSTISLRLLDLTGQVVMEEKNISGTTFTIDISNQPKGMYLLEVVENNIISISKVLRQ